MTSNQLIIKKIAVIGGTGDLGAGLSMRFALANIIKDIVQIDDIVLGSRSEERAKQKAEIYNKILVEYLSKDRIRKDFFARIGYKEALKGKLITGAHYCDAVSDADIVFFTIPYKAIEEIIKELKPCLKKNAIIIDSMVPLVNENGIFIHKTNDNFESASEHLAALLPNHVIIGAFKTISAETLQEIGTPINRSVFIFGNDPKARELIVTLGNLIEGISVVELKSPSGIGDLIFARQIETIVAALINTNKSCGETCLGINVTGWHVKE